MYLYTNKFPLPLIKDALNAGKHVFEKPLCRNFQEAQEIL